MASAGEVGELRPYAGGARSASASPTPYAPPETKPETDMDYIYRIAPPSKVRIAYLDGRQVRLAALSYAYKPSWRDEVNEPLDRRLIAPRDLAWDKKHPNDL